MKVGSALFFVAFLFSRATISQAQPLPNDYPYAESIFVAALKDVKTYIAPTLTRQQQSLFRTIALNVDTNFQGGSYIGSDLRTKIISVNRSFVYWLYNRSLAQTLDSLQAFDRKGFLDLFDRLFVYIDPKVPVFAYAKIDTSVLNIKNLVDTSVVFRNYYYLNLLFIYTHELGHFMRHTVTKLTEERNALASKMLAVNASDTSFQATMARMENCFTYYAFEQGLEVEADAFALEKTLATSFMRQLGPGVERLKTVFTSATSILEAYKYAKSGFILDIPISAANLLIRSQMMLYTKDSLAISYTHAQEPEARKLALALAGKQMEDSVRAVAEVIFNLCENPQGRYESRLKEIEEDTTFQFTSWEYYTGFMQNYLAQSTSSDAKYGLVLTTINKILSMAEKAGQSSSTFGETFRSGLKEYLYLTLASIAEYLLQQPSLARTYYEKAAQFSVIIPPSFYRQVRRMVR
ncbi:MAG TPA: hypothetical protein VMR70_10635 [Flavisolibacter sp.]|nr:hypothetical protein [Flavisolibacter sp.]